MRVINFLMSSSVCYGVLFWIIFISCFHIGKMKDLRVICPELDAEIFTVHEHVTPFGNVSAGHYTKLKHVDTLHECVAGCCADVTCNVAFFFNKSCFHLKCHSKELCQPNDRTGKKFENSYMVLVRLPGDNVLWEAKNEVGSLMTGTSQYADFYTDADDDDYPSYDSGDVAADILPSHSATKLKPCEYGINIDCGPHETCVHKNTRSRAGFCRCITGYVRGPDGKCGLARLTGTKKSTTAANSSLTQMLTTKQDNFTASSTIATPIQLVVSAGDNVTLHLPDNEVTLSAYALKGKEKEGDLKYEWTLISHPEGDETGTMQDQNTKNLKLSKLRAGIYTFKVTVTGTNAVGEASVNVTVLPPDHPNKPPVVIIQPSNVTMKLPNKETVLDGSFSTDDDKIVKYQWEVLQVPIGYSVQLNETATLQLKNLIPGFYRFKLTVTDSKGATNFTFANVTVQKETDYPPTANAKSEVVIYLPQNSVVLNGNLSTDDKGIKSWEWKKSPDNDKVVDMEGTNSPYLHLSQLEVGVYKFILKVTDTADQTSTTEVHLFVKPESNTPPAAIVGPDLKVNLPLKNPVILDGSRSKDDIKIARYLWEQIQGPKPAVLSDENSPTAKASGLVPGYYQFKLTVCDEKSSNSSAILNVTVIQTQNMPPHANAGGDKTVYLPCDVVVMNGSASSDDAGIVKYRWTREPDSLAAGTILENSDQSAVLKLSQLISGRYLFRLTVYDRQGDTSSETASLIIKPPTSIMDQVEIIVDADIKSFTQEQEDAVLRQLEMLIHVGDPIAVRLIKLDSDRNSRRVILVFVVEKTSSSNHSLYPGVEVVSRLKKKLRTDSSLLDVEVISLDTVVCQNTCSGHGSCDLYTKRCICEAFWMHDIFRIYLGDKESNCDWSILYVIIVSFTIVVILAGIMWGLACCYTNMKFRKPKKRHRYTLLDGYGDKEKEREKFIPRSKKQFSMSDSESDAIFEAQRVPTTKVANGVLNGLVKNPHKVTA